MSNGTAADWFDRDKKSKAILRVMKYITVNPAEGKKCIGNDAQAHKLFEDPRIGNIQIPKGGRVVIFDTGEENLEPGSSIIIELPPNPPPAPPKFSGAWSDTELMTFVLGNYKYWGG